ncbi:unnamed protein product [Parnassius mnemosyne]|uniref:PHD-type domain-containing protein n=1 Tax=Parnassius mnemosyne TaxID=213953 RepID=A0AAV1LZW1_9NEOP
MYPFNPDRIPECAYAPSIPTHLSEAGEPESNSDENNAASIINAASVLNDESFSYEDNVPLILFQSNEQQNVLSSYIRDEPAPLASLNINEAGNVSFTDMMKTPEKNSSNKSQRRKTINSLAQHLTRSMFAKINPTVVNTPSSIKASHPGKRRKQATKQAQSWCCFLCKEDRVADMRLCKCSGVYVHEECVGLTAEDKERYMCPKCEN